MIVHIRVTRALAKRLDDAVKRAPGLTTRSGLGAVSMDLGLDAALQKIGIPAAAEKGGAS